MDPVAADTHAALWYLLEPSQLSAAADQALTQADRPGVGIFVSAISVVEVIYLVEKGKLPQASLDALVATLTDPAEAMHRYVAWIGTLPGRPVFVAYPAGFDFLFVYWYLIRFTGESPFSFSALDVKTYAMALLRTEYRESVKRNMPKRWFDKLPHSHVALDDALEQGALFCNMLAENRARADDSGQRG